MCYKSFSLSLTDHWSVVDTQFCFVHNAKFVLQTCSDIKQYTKLTPRSTESFTLDNNHERPCNVVFTLSIGCIIVVSDEPPLYMRLWIFLSFRFIMFLFSSQRDCSTMSTFGLANIPHKMSMVQRHTRLLN